jgi:hypothetical protein
MQDTAIAFNELFMRVWASPPLFLHTPGTQLVQEGTDGLSRAEASERRKSEATRALRDIVIDQARFLEQDITIDLFATADNTLVRSGVAYLYWGSSVRPGWRHFISA